MYALIVLAAPALQWFRETIPLGNFISSFNLFFFAAMCHSWLDKRTHTVQATG